MHADTSADKGEHTKHWQVPECKCSKHESTCLFYRSGGEERCRDRNGCSDQKALVSAEGQAQIQEGPPQTFKFIRRARATPVRN